MPTTEIQILASGFNKKKENVESAIEEKKSAGIAATEEKVAAEAAARTAFNQAALSARDANLAANLEKQTEMLQLVRDAADNVIGDETSTGDVSDIFELEALIQDNYDAWISEKVAAEARLAEKRDEISTAFGQVSDYTEASATVPSITILV